MAFFEDLKSWQQAQELTISIYKIMYDCKDYGFRDQIQRAAVSIMNNIAEGSESGTNQTFIRFLNIAKGSCAEVRSMLYLCEKFNYCTKEEQNQLLNNCRIISASISNLIKYLRTLL